MSSTDFSAEARSLLSHLLNLPLRDRLSVIENILNNAWLFEPNGKMRQNIEQDTTQERMGYAQPGKIYQLKNGEIPTVIEKDDSIKSGCESKASEKAKT